MDGYEVIQTKATDIQYVDATEKANVDSQVATAKQYPRDLYTLQRLSSQIGEI